MANTSLKEIPKTFGGLAFTDTTAYESVNAFQQLYGRTFEHFCENGPKILSSCFDQNRLAVQLKFYDKLIPENMSAEDFAEKCYLNFMRLPSLMKHLQDDIQPNPETLVATLATMEALQKLTAEITTGYNSALEEVEHKITQEQSRLLSNIKNGTAPSEALNELWKDEKMLAEEFRKSHRISSAVGVITNHLREVCQDLGQSQGAAATIFTVDSVNRGIITTSATSTLKALGTAFGVLELQVEQDDFLVEQLSDKNFQKPFDEIYGCSFEDFCNGNAIKKPYFSTKNLSKAFKEHHTLVPEGRKTKDFAEECYLNFMLLPGYAKQLKMGIQPNMKRLESMVKTMKAIEGLTKRISNKDRSEVETASRSEVTTEGSLDELIGKAYNSLKIHAAVKALTDNLHKTYNALELVNERSAGR